ncbi:TonB-dependent receptor [Comamonas testosteroni]|uniref:TonB-dependent receptor n=1 Tax=Comamonas testosteroni (strain DSM 14576 / KF-1) TaxID=399795 RepID=B7WWU0_COMTK|nr:TonB-dependent receptor [Comamonas testosteroni]EED67824.1 TonB-dependent receptor [Comamonas testosteroni KF-1]WQG65949.1 TonB-dependent receptor [Comamonas testosteroni]
MHFSRLCHLAGWPVAAAGLLLTAQSALAQQAAAQPDLPQLSEVTVRSTLQQSALEQTPASVTVLDGERMRERNLQVNLSESLGAAPGLQLQNRQNYAQDLQLSIRGFGARSTFGVRGIQIYVDGIPSTMPDGQGQTNNIDIASLERVEVLRGPYSALYGNASGGVINAYTERGEGAPSVESSFALGSDGQKRLGLKAKGEANGIGYVLSASRFLTDGYRAQSAADKNLFNARIDVRPDEYSQLTLVANHVDIDAKDPGGIEPMNWAKNPKMTTPNALTYNSRKSVKQTQAGLTYERELGAGQALRFMAYAGQREMMQFQSIPSVSQTVTKPENEGNRYRGGVIGLKRDYGGIDARWSGKYELGSGSLGLIAGLAANTVREDRQGYKNFVGNQLGVVGELVRDERNTLTSIDPYLQASWAFAPRWKLDAGLRWSNVQFQSRDHFLADKDDSGNAGFHKLLPVVSLQHELNQDTNIYASLGRGMETPTFNEISYRPDLVGGLNFGLKPAVSTSAELGIKQRFNVAGLRGDWSAALFQTQTDNEIVVASNDNGRASYQNAGKTRRRGMELSTSTWLMPQLRLNGALTLLDASLRSGYCDSKGQDCIPSGNRIAGTARHLGYLGLEWLPATDWRVGLDWRHGGRIAADDKNQVYAPSYNVASLSVGYTKRLGAWKLSAFARVDNLADKNYVGSVIVNEGNGRYYEPAPGRQWMAGTSLSYQF